MTKLKKGNPIKHFLIEYNTYIIFLVLLIVCTILSPDFFTAMNLRNLALQQSAPVIIAIGMLFVILTGGIDLSVGSLMAFGSSFAAVLIMNYGIHFVPAILIAMCAALLLGMFTGVLVAYAKMQGFVASLAMMTIARGVAFILTQGRPIRVDEGTLDLLVNRNFHFPIIIISVIIVIIFFLIQKFTAYGRIVIAVGSNSTAVQLAGIRVKRYIVSVYAISAILASLGGVYIAARASTGSATIGMGQELDAIAAVVIGGASLAGGRGFVFRTVIGALVLALIGNIMNLMAVPSYPQDVIRGFIIIAAVLLQVLTSKQEQTV
ncbi:MAG: ABC transporter permease [Lachnospiraceae bacterium]|nr:ABC transporter permease [Lachnospiraceae bacterium]